MTKKRKRAQVELYDHTAYRQGASASVVDFNFDTRVLKVTTRTVNVVPRPEPPSESQSSTYAEDATQDIPEVDVGVLVRTKTRAKRYLNSVRMPMLHYDYW